MARKCESGHARIPLLGLGIDELTGRSVERGR